MNNKGFTLVELLAVLVIISLVASIGTVSVTKLSSDIKENMLQNKKELILYEAKVFGEDYKAALVTTCGKSGKTDCDEITVQDLIDNNYLNPKDTCVDANNNEFKCFKNNVNDNNMNDDIIDVYLNGQNVEATYYDV